jgi:uncharacterized cupin superfamily protein
VQPETTGEVQADDDAQEFVRILEGSVIGEEEG